MIVIKKRNQLNEFEPYLVIEGDEMWGYDPMWSNHPEFVKMDADELKSSFEGSFNWVVDETDSDPFEDIPMSAEVCRNYPPGTEDIPDVDAEEPDAAEKAADRAVDAFFRMSGSGGPTLTKDEYERADDVLKDMHDKLAGWEGDDLSKAPPVWDDDSAVPDFVKEVIKQVMAGNIVWDKFDGYSHQAAQAIQNSLEENLTQPQGWSIASLVDDLQEMYPGMDQSKAINIARTETSAILNSAREAAYEQRDDSAEYNYYWQGPGDHRRTKVCEEITEEVEKRGGNVDLQELKSILHRKARKYEGTREGGTPERVSEWTPHFQCRHTFIRDVRGEL